MLSFSFMKDSDAAAVSQLARRIWLAYYSSLISTAQIEYMLARRYSVEALCSDLRDGQKVLTARQGDEIAGFLGIGALSKIDNAILRGDCAEEGGYFLHRCYLAPELHGQGIGSKLFTEILTRLPDIALIRLQVHRANLQAQNFYKRLGFTIAAQADFDIGGGFTMQDYVMQWEKH